MVGKRKLRYKNFNICQLVDKGKLKLQYLDEFKESKKIHGKITKQIEHQDKIHKSEKDLDFIEPNVFLHIENIVSNLFDFSILKNNLTYEFVKNCCKFVEIKNKLNNTSYFAILILGDSVLLNYNELPKENPSFIIINEEEIAPYLLSFNIVKEKYTVDEIKEIFYKYLKTKQNIDKKLIK